MAAIYKLYSFRLNPIFFYTYSVFCLQGVFMTSLYLLSWSLTGSWLAGLLTAVREGSLKSIFFLNHHWWSLTRSLCSRVRLFFNDSLPCSVMVNRFDVTRVNFTVPLREHFSLPFIFLQFLLAGQFLAMKTNNPPGWTRWSPARLCSSTRCSAAAAAGGAQCGGGWSWALTSASRGWA